MVVVRLRHLRLKQVWLFACTLLVLNCGAQKPPMQPPLSVNDFLRSKKDDGFQKALHPIAFEFPRDHGAHPRFRNEWWYITGNLRDKNNRRFGFQFTLFRNALSAEPVNSESRWATSQVYLAHVALTDAQRKRHYSDERFARGALGLAGVDHTPFQAWLEDWRLVSEPIESCASCLRLRLEVDTDEFSLDLNLNNTKPVVLHGEAGLSQKSETKGNASYYYSYTRLQSAGRVTLNDVEYTVAGQSWLDHEWSTSSLQPDQVGWDWFSVQLSDQTELMLFQLRHELDSDQNFLYGTYVNAKGQTKQLNGSGFTVNATGSWTSPATGAIYPAGWTISIHDYAVKLWLTPLIPGQELSTSFTYWEGAVNVRGTKNNQSLQGQGYVELTGYH